MTTQFTPDQQTLGRSQDSSFLQTALDHIKRPLRHLKNRKMSFLCGDAGPLALGAVIYSRLGKNKESKDCLSRLEGLQHKLEDDSLPDELLFGRVGYLFSLLFVQKQLGPDAMDSTHITKVVKLVLRSGRTMSERDGWSHPLMFAWHDKHYLGAAHGLAGIFYTLMQVHSSSLQPDIDKLVKPSIDYMLTLRFPSGNCPSSIGSNTDKLVHWCHGAPGWIHMFVLAYKTYKDEKYLKAAKDCAQVIWQRGLLKKGYGICHGLAGNAYAFLTMYKLTGDMAYLYKAYKFAEWCFDYGKHGCRTPDRPFSLFEGMAGTIYFLADLLDPQHAQFPAFEL
ncbi:lanC-like protein 2 isoform X2 [Gigantopelta aegis]|uniref:lanC-like protein 2 isoform X2 n=1 Tax=Gigantopelta aegis TaxID=1735272 RepID=UPI001B88D81E|nr:lanC-like protein 2 isoform X2 [Gigantopelta aegis]XP_041365619.1 lanC-like protein 2 isoform X2 [Gigantopelta aegis]